MACLPSSYLTEILGKTGSESPLCPLADAAVPSSRVSAGEPDPNPRNQHHPPGVIRNGFQSNVTLAQCPILYTGQVPAVDPPLMGNRPGRDPWRHSLKRSPCRGMPVTTIRFC